MELKLNNPIKVNDKIYDKVYFNTAISSQSNSVAIRLIPYNDIDGILQGHDIPLILNNVADFEDVIQKIINDNNI